MNKLLRASRMRLKKNKLFWGCCCCTSLILVFACLNQHYWSQELQNQYYLDNFIFGFLIYIGIMLSVFSSLFIGTEYNDGTIRNKIIAGHGRSSIYIANVLTCSFAGVALSMLSMLTVFAIGVPLFGFLQMSAALFALQLLTAILVTLTYASILNLLSMLITNRTYAAVVNILLAVLSVPAATQIYKHLGLPESDYTEQAGITIFNLSFTVAESTLLILIIILVCILIIFSSNLIGIFLFRRKDLK